VKSRPYWNEPRMIDNQQAILVKSSIALLQDESDVIKVKQV
jgi:hypothetical protein